MIFLADESVDFGIVLKLRNQIQVVSVMEEFSGLHDSEVLEVAFSNNYVLITEDKDFGELSYRFNLNHSGIVLLRNFNMKRENKIDLIAELIIKNRDLFQNKFSVISENGIRIR